MLENYGTNGNKKLKRMHHQALPIPLSTWHISIMLINVKFWGTIVPTPKSLQIFILSIR